MNSTSPIKILPGGRKTRRSPSRRCKYGMLSRSRYINGRRQVCRKTPRRRSSPRRRSTRRSPRRRSTRRSPRRRSTRRSPRRRSTRRRSPLTTKSKNRCSRHPGARSCGSDPACFWDVKRKKCSLPRARAKQTFYGPMGKSSRDLMSKIFKQQPSPMQAAKKTKDAVKDAQAAAKKAQKARQEAAAKAMKAAQLDKCYNQFCKGQSKEKKTWRKCYLQGVKVHHPDKGGNINTFQALNDCNQRINAAL